MHSTLVRISAGMVLPIIVLIGAYIASPYVAVHNFVGIAKSGDVDQIDAAVDFPRVRESLKAQFNASLVAHMQTDPAMQDNPFAGLSMMMGPAIIDRMVDAVITPEGIASLVRSGQVKRDGAQPAASNPNVKVASSYVTLDRFKTVITNKAGADALVTMTFERRGLFAWRLIRVELPMPADSPVTPTATPANPTPGSDGGGDNANRAAANAPEHEGGSDMPATDASPGDAEALPSYDEAAYCQKIGNTAGGSNVIERTCRQQEANARAAVERMSIPSRTLRYCRNIGGTAGGSYVIFKTCIEQELDDAG